MKKVLSLVVAALFVSSSAFAATTVKNTIVATAAFAGEASFTFTLKTVNGDAAATTLDWTKADAFNMGEDTVWVMADQYAEVYAVFSGKYGVDGNCLKQGLGYSAADEKGGAYDYGLLKCLL